MAYAASGLALMTHAAGTRLFVYKTTDTAADVDTAGYFNSAAPQLNLGDVVLRLTFSSAAMTTLSSAGFHVVNSNDGSTVDMQDQLALTGALGASVSDTD